MLTGEKYKNYFDKDYYETAGYKAPYNKQNFRRDSYLHWAITTWIVQSLKLHGTERVLEIGCACGWTVEQFIKKHNMDVYGQDISHYATHNAPVEIQDRIRECNNVEIAFDGEFELIYSLETFEHVPKPLVIEYFTNIYNVLADDGILFCTICLGWNDERGADIDLSHQTLQPREWWNEKFEQAGFTIRKDLEAEAYELGLQTAEMSQGEWLPRKYNWHVFVLQKNVQEDNSDIRVTENKPNLLIIGNRDTSFSYPVEPFFQIDNWGNYLYKAFNSRYIGYNKVTQNDLDGTDLIIATLCIEVIGFINSIDGYNGKILGIVDGTPFMIETPDIRPKMIQCLNKIDIVGNIHTQGRELYSLFCDKNKIVNYGHIFPVDKFDDIYKPVDDGAFTILTGGYFNSRCGMPSVSAYIAAREADKVICPIIQQGLNELKESHEVLPNNIELLKTVPQHDLWRNILPYVDILLHLGNHPATGRLTADCAAAGIPGIGINTYYQEICFPELLVDSLYDVEKSRHLIRKLRDDRQFYDELALRGRQRLISSNATEIERIYNILRRMGFNVFA